MDSIGKRIKTLRVLYWLSQSEIAQRVGVSQRQIAYWESGDDLPSAERIPRICEVLHVSPGWLLTGGWLKEVYSAAKAAENRERKARLLQHLPTAADFEEPARGEWIDALPEDSGALVVRISDETLAPVYRPGDQIFFQPLQIILPAALELLTPLANRQIAVEFNGEESMKVLLLEPKAPDGFSTRIQPLVGKREKQVRKSDRLVIRGVAYKCVRAI